MKPVEFPQMNAKIAEHQKEYVTLPAHIVNEPEGRIICCLELDDDEIEEIVRTRKIWHQQLTFHQPMQPIFLSTKNPFSEEIPKEPNKMIKSLGFAKTIGELKKIIDAYPNDTSFGFRNQPMQQLHEVKMENDIYVVFQEE